MKFNYQEAKLSCVFHKQISVANEKGQVKYESSQVPITINNITITTTIAITIFYLHLGTGRATKSDEFSEKLQRGGVNFNQKIAEFGNFRVQGTFVQQSY